MWDHLPIVICFVVTVGGFLASLVWYMGRPD
jgi:hypothetical protein